MLATHYTLHQDYGMSHPQSSYEARRVSVNLPRVNNRARHSFHSVRWRENIVRRKVYKLLYQQQCRYNHKSLFRV